jgi:lipoyl(octanoyl) transferase
MALLTHLKHLGNMPYQQAWDYQEELMQYNLAIKQAQRTAEINKEDYKGEDTVSHLLFVEHPHVYSLGKSGSMENLLLNETELAEKNITFTKTNRGGDITYHGPGQIVAYPILDLEKIKADIVWYMRTLEEVVIKTITEFGIEAGRSDGETGVWLDIDNAERARKICAMGVRTSRWITMHGLALNVNTDLQYFNYIIPCGIKDKGVTSMEKELGKFVNIQEVETVMQKYFALEFGLELV